MTHSTLSALVMKLVTLGTPDDDGKITAPKDLYAVACTAMLFNPSPDERTVISMIADMIDRRRRVDGYTAYSFSSQRLRARRDLHDLGVCTRDLTRRFEGFGGGNPVPALVDKLLELTAGPEDSRETEKAVFLVISIQAFVGENEAAMAICKEILEPKTYVSGLAFRDGLSYIEALHLRAERLAALCKGVA